MNQAPSRMSSPATIPEFLGVLRKSAVVAPERLDAFLRGLRERRKQWAGPAAVAAVMLQDGLLSQFQVRHLLHGRSRGFWIKRYLVLEELGAGGMGRVYLCEQTPMQRLVAVKVLPAKTPPGALERFLREARASAALDHPNLVRAFDVDHEDRFHFLVLEFVDGPTLQQLVEDQGPLDVARACHYAAQAALGLHHAHLAGWIHRDVKPANLVVDRGGTVKVLDLGLARFAQGFDEQLTKQFDDRNLLGTADYIAPEQSMPDHAVDSRADIYSLGATLYFLLTGQAPFGERNLMQKLMAHQLSDPPPIAELRPEVQAALAAVIARMMAKSPARRYQTAEQVAVALQPFAEGGPFPPEPEELVTRSARVQLLAQAQALKPPPPLPRSLAEPEPVGELAEAEEGDAPQAAPKAAPKRAISAPGAPAARRRHLVIGLAAGGAALFLAVLVCGGGYLGFLAWRNNNTGPISKTSPVDVKLAADGRDYLTPQEAAQKLDQRCKVQFVVKRAALSKNQKTLFLNSDTNYKADTNFSIVIHGVDQGPIGVAELPATYLGKAVRVDGLVTLYEGRPQIVLTDAGQVRVVDPAK